MKLVKKNSKKETSKQEIKTSNTASGASVKDREVITNVLFQKIYNKWYAFSVSDEECFMSEVAEDQVNSRVKKAA